jgi:hypothetical protein
MIRKALLSQEEMQLLMVYADGESTGNDRLMAERLLLVSLDARAYLEAQADLGASLRRSGGRHDSFSVADAVMASVDSTSRRAPAQVIPLSAGKRNLRRMGAGVVAALAMAAGAAVMIRARVSGSEVKTLTEVQDVETSNQYHVFDLPGVINAKASSVVIWIDDNSDALKGELAAPLPTATSVTSTAPTASVPPTPKKSAP